MILIRGWYKDTGLTGTLFEKGESPPSYSGSADTDSPYTWVCDSFYQVSSGGTIQEIDGQKVRVAFERPILKGYRSKEMATDEAKEHIKTQFTRIGVNSEEVEFEYIEE